VKLSESQEKFIQTWGVLGGNWGINKTMAQIHALLMASSTPLCTEDMMEALTISRGNTNMNVRVLVEWGLVTKEMVSGDRKDYYAAKKDIWVIARQIAKQRKSRELEPVLNSLQEIKLAMAKEGNTDEAFAKQIEDIENFTLKVDQMLTKFVESDESWFYKIVLKLM
jgi:DNA-binding transcriptional regulator GbsR (MarR family)